MYCPQCGVQMPDGTLVCQTCGWREVLPSTGIDHDPAMRVLLPVGRSTMAIAAGYLGLVSVIFFPAPFALLTGILALRDIKLHPEKGGKGRAIFGVVMGSIFSCFLVGFIVMGVLAAMGF